MSYLGDFRLGDTLDFKFTTRQISGAPFTLASSPVISAYPGNSTTELTAGITLSVDFDSRTGLNNVRVVATSGNGYATATNYELVITTGTVNSVSVVGEVVGTFSIENRSALMPTTAARTLVVDAAGLADANAVKLGPTGSGTALTARDIGLSVLLAAGQKVDVDTIKTNPVVNAGTVTFPTTATLASTTNLTAGTIATVSGNVNGNVAGSVGSVTGAVGSVTGLTASNLDATVSSRLASASYTAPDSAATIAAAVWATVIDGTNTAIKLMRGFAAALLGKASGLATTSAVYRNAPDSKDVITATVDADGNRTAVTLDLT